MVSIIRRQQKQFYSLLERCESLEKENQLLRDELAKHATGMLQIRKVERTLQLPHSERAYPAGDPDASL